LPLVFPDVPLKRSCFTAATASGRSGDGFCVASFVCARQRSGGPALDFVHRVYGRRPKARQEQLDELTSFIRRKRKGKGSNVMAKRAPRPKPRLAEMAGLDLNAVYQGMKASVSIDDGRVLAGDFPARQLRMVQV
jgi:hypothetical protein